MSDWKYIDASRRIVARDNPAGYYESRSVDDHEIAAWIDAGNVPADAPGLLAQVKAKATRRVDREAEDRQRRHAKSVDQDMIEEAHDLKKDNDQDVTRYPAKYPFLTAIQDVQGGDLKDIADAVLADRRQRKAKAAAIEKARLSAAAAIEGASTVEAVEVVLGQVAWPE